VVLGAVEARTTSPWLVLGVVATAIWWIVTRVDCLVARGLVENDLEAGQSGDGRWRQCVEGFKRGLVDHDESVGRIEQSSYFDVQRAA
jgi:hypothetical protein